MVILEIGGNLVQLGSLTDQIYTLVDDLGWEHHWNVTEGLRLAERRGGMTFFSPTEQITVEEIRTVYVDLHEKHALTTDLSLPLLFVTLNGHRQLVDGWHRLFKAVVTRERVLPAYVLSERESEAVLIMRFPPGRGIGLEANDAANVNKSVGERRTS